MSPEVEAAAVLKNTTDVAVKQQMRRAEEHVHVRASTRLGTQALEGVQRAAVRRSGERS